MPLATSPSPTPGAKLMPGSTSTPAPRDPMEDVLHLIGFQLARPPAIKGTAVSPAPARLYGRPSPPLLRERGSVATVATSVAAAATSWNCGPPTSKSHCTRNDRSLPRLGREIPGFELVISSWTGHHTLNSTGTEIRRGHRYFLPCRRSNYPSLTRLIVHQLSRVRSLRSRS